MAKALQDIPERAREVPSGVEMEGGDWVIPEFKERTKYASLTE